MNPATWRSTVARHLLPELSGDWAVRSDLAYRRPTEWILTGIGMASSQYGGSFWHELVVQPLFVPLRGWMPLGVRLGDGSAEGERFGDFEHPDDGAQQMQRLADLMRSDGTPLLDRLGTVRGLTSWYDQRCDEDPLNANWWEGAAGLAVLLDDDDRVKAATDGMARAAATDPRPWVSAVHDRTRLVLEAYDADPRTAWNELASRAEETRAHIGLV